MLNHFPHKTRISRELKFYDISISLRQISSPFFSLFISNSVNVILKGFNILKKPIFYVPVYRFKTLYPVLGVVFQ